MATIPLESFPVEERMLVNDALGRAGVAASDIRITKAVFRSAQMPGDISQLVTVVHHSNSRTYGSTGSGWIQPFVSDLTRDVQETILEARRKRTPAAAYPGAFAGSSTRTRRRPDSMCRVDDQSVLEVIRGLPELAAARAHSFVAVIHNELGTPYREVSLCSVWESVQLTAGLTALGFQWTTVQREGKSRKVGWVYSTPVAQTC